MDIHNLKHVVGLAEHNQPAIIRFFGAVDSCSTERFNEEFLWLQEVVKPSKIIVMINSEGGSVLYGMSTFSVIQACPIEVDCIIEGIAASMGSVLWVAGDNLYMHDYSLLMIHNPFIHQEKSDDKSAQNAIGAFKKQLEVIYQKRFGLSKETVQSIMNGEEGADGTFFTAKDAVKAGLIAADNIIKTPKQVRSKIKNQIEGIEDAASLRDIMTSIADEVDENKLLEEIAAIHNRKVKPQTQESEEMESTKITNFDAISAQLGFSEDAQMTAVTARIADLIKIEADFKALQGEHTALEIKFNGKEAALANALSELDEVKASLQKYQDAEAAAFEAKVAQTIQDAIDAGKIEGSAKEAWVKFAHADFATVEATLGSIQARENITEQIATDPNNINAIEDTLKTVEEKTKEKVKEVVGEVKFLTFK